MESPIPRYSKSTSAQRGESLSTGSSSPFAERGAGGEVKRNLSRPWAVSLVLCILYLAILYIHYYGLHFQTQSPLRAGRPINLGLLTIRYNGGPLEFVWPTSAGQPGYDGQFTYYIALDPLHAAPYLDVPAYRYQRILHPLLARLLALGQESLVLWAMLTINLIALAIGTAALEQLLQAERINRWYALIYGLFGGIFIAIRVGTSEPLAYGLVLCAILAGKRDQYVWHAILFALALLAKETTIFFVAGYLVYYALEHRWRDVIRLALIAIVPFVLWEVVLRLWLGHFGIGSGGALATPFEIIPFNGIWRLFEYPLAVIVGFGLLPFGAALLPTLWALWRGARDTLRHRWHPYVFLLLANAAIMPFVPFSTYREPLGIARFLDGLVIAVVLYAALRRARRALMYSTLWIMFTLLLLG